ncbi:MAG: histidine triad nucleotide-binding protein [Chloroflexi bacterium]|nr:histidine triad nucleotide-binding protein [Chloroflexota bacterium]
MVNHDENCIFCKIIRKEIPSEIVYQDEKVTAFKDLSPIAPVHVLIVPNTHIPSLSESSSEHAELLGEVLLAGAKIARDLKIDQSGYRIVVNNGADAGQTVFHIHFHLLGGRELHFKTQ